MIHYVEIYELEKESFISYCSEEDFEYIVYKGDKCKVVIDKKCIVGTLFEVNSKENTITLKKDNGEILAIKCEDIDEIYVEEEVKKYGNVTNCM